MSEDVKQKLFKIFADFQNTYFTESKIQSTSGIGLGLNMSKILIKAMEGAIEINSHEGQGTEVLFRIRVNQEKCKSIH